MSDLYYINKNLMKFCIFAAEMDCVRKFWILKYLAICLACLLADKADDLLCHDTNVIMAESCIQLADSDCIDNSTYSFSSPDIPCRVPRQTNIANTVRTFTQAKRPNHPNMARHGFTLAKSGKSIKHCTKSLFSLSILNFPSGLTQTNHRLISLGRLII